MLSIVIPTRCRPDLLRLCLTSVSRYAPAASEIVVVDDASGTAEVGQVVSAFFGVKLVRLERRSGFAAAANAGIRASQGDIVELLNDDTEVEAGWAEHALSWFADPDIGAVAPLVLTWPDGQRVDSAGDRYYLGGVAGKRGHGEAAGADFSKPAAVFGASASSGFFRRGALMEVGLFPESFGSYFEDVDLAFRLQRAGYQAVFEPRARVLHRISASFGRPDRRLLEQQSRNEELVFWRNLPGRWLGRALPLHLVVLAGKAWRRWQDGSLTPFLMGRLRVLGELRLLREHRCVLGRRACAELAGWQVEKHFWADLSP